jgi:hypothetical protein
MGVCRMGGGTFGITKSRSDFYEKLGFVNSKVPCRFMGYFGIAQIVGQ